ncbi:hypothetical protein [Clostridium butyricum]|uniref:hypothetical protein n=2 Tax=Clostridium butyricum TaxID=1492 RepID=UPI00168BF181|nr:hypothetical protein [Clostridium butyricum]MDB2151982.1 hypothetical protein [Clostridium butyricum]
MIEYLQKNVISIFSLIISIFVLLFSRKTAKLNSYNQKGCYNIFFIPLGFFAKLMKKYNFTVKISNSAYSKVIPFEHELIITPKIGGIYEAQMFSAFDDELSLGVNKTLTNIVPKKEKHSLSKEYAYKSVTSFSSTPLYPYFSVSGKFGENACKCEKKLNRYHFYIQIADYCNNIEIWYISFSLLLSNLEDEQKSWRKCSYDTGYAYYTFDDINIVSPRDIPKNLNRSNRFKKCLEEIEGKEENSLDSSTLIKDGFDTMNQNLQLFEMKEYIAFLKNLSDEKLR